MTPIERIFWGLLSLISDFVGASFRLFEGMDSVQLGTVSVCAMILAALCLRGNPVRGA